MSFFFGPEPTAGAGFDRNNFAHHYRHDHVCCLLVGGMADDGWRVLHVALLELLRLHHGAPRGKEGSCVRKPPYDGGVWCY